MKCMYIISLSKMLCKVVPEKIIMSFLDGIYGELEA